MSGVAILKSQLKYLMKVALSTESLFPFDLTFNPYEATSISNL